MTITYTVGSGLYINLTNRCTCDCDFCERNFIETVGTSGSLWLEREPTCDEILADLALRNLFDYDELVFCGFGEPTLRLDVILEVAKVVKAQAPALLIRINTNGHANYIAGKDITPQMHGLIDVLSISLNRPDSQSYQHHIRPDFDGAFQEAISFTRLAKEHVGAVTLSVVDMLSAEDLEKCRKIADELGVNFRIRPLH